MMNNDHKLMRKVAFISLMGFISYETLLMQTQAANLTNTNPTSTPCSYSDATKSIVCGNATVKNGADGTKSAVSIGDDAKANANQSIAIGKNSEVVGEKVWSMGQDGLTYKNTASDNSIAIGVDTRVDGPDAIAVGNGAKIHRSRHPYPYWDDSAGSVAIGHNAEVLANDAENGAVAYTDTRPGPNWSTAGGATAIGHNAKTSVGAATALGAARANAIRSIAIGAWGNTGWKKLYAETRAANSTAIGDQSLVGEFADGGQAIGGGATILPKSIGAIAFGVGAVAQGKGAIAIGGDNSIPDSEVALGSQRVASAIAGAENSVALASNAKVFDGSKSGIAIGHGAQVGQGEVEFDGETGIPTVVTSETISENGIAIGKDAKVLGNNSIAIGTGNVVEAESSGAFGDPTIITKEATGSYSIGNNNTISTAHTYALGSDIENTVEDSVFLGDRSASTGVHTIATGGNYTYAGRNDANVAGIDNVVGVVSVGNENETRQIQHVAAGVVAPNSTDAINGSQLYDTHKAIDNLGNQVQKVNKNLRAGIAGAAALGMLPQPTLPGKSMVSIGTASYRNQSAVAVGVSRVSDNQKIVIKLGASANTRKDYIVGGAVGYQW